MKLKADLHIHTGEDPFEKNISYTAKELIDRASEKGFDALSITNHNTITFSDSLEDYSRKQGILLIPGIEIRIQGKDIILLNFSPSEVEKIKVIEDIMDINNHTKLVIAPHPFYPCANALNSQFKKNIGVFDGIELTSLYFRWINFNRKAIRTAEKFALPLIGSSDTHFLPQLGSTYSLIAAEKNIESVIHAIKEKKIEVATQPMALNLWNIKVAMRFSLHSFIKIGQNRGMEKF